MHRDLKPSNLLIDPNAECLKIADFGLARTFGLPLKSYTHEVVTLWYRAPEVLLGQKQYSLPVDTWSVGCIFAEMVEKRPLFMGDSEIDQIFKIFQFHGTPTNLEWPGVTDLPDFKNTFPKFKKQNPETYFKNFDKLGLDLFNQMICLDPAKRIPMKFAMNHPYFDDLNKSELLASMN